MSTAPFGRLLTAMVTPFTADGELDLEAAAALAAYLVDEQRNDALVINGTTGESPTTTDEEKRRLLEVVVATVGDRAQVLAGVGTNDTYHSVGRVRDAAEVGAHGLLAVTPYYSRPPQDAIIEHFRTLADASDLPLMLYDIPHRAGVALESDTLLRLAEHPRVVAVKDAKGQPAASAVVMAQSGLAYYAGDDAMLLPLMAVGGVGVVGTSTHVTGARTADCIAAWLAGDLEQALRIYRELLPVYTGVFATQAVMLVKAALRARGRPVGSVRRPLLDATEAETARFVALLDAAGL
ncbi:MAG: 4-hydroxy-tetrahydrodipicolinate synthase [Actinomycetia bacterium]|nr:4-hydroxy-tetrahydrodipicolinate synthase [Actinomycetes bacterium]